MKLCYQLDGAGYYLGEAVADESPLEPGVYHLPENCIFDAPPEPIDGKLRRYLGGQWGYVDAPAPTVAPAVPDMAAAAVLADWKARVRGALAASDITVLRCFEDGIELPDAWKAYRAELRALLAATATSALPDVPPYPEGQ